MYRQPNRNPRRFYINIGHTLEMCQLADAVIDVEVAKVGIGGDLLEVKDKVFDALYTGLSWWDPTCVDFPSHCRYDGTTINAWGAVRRHWGHTHPGRALHEVLELDARPGVRGGGGRAGIWTVITNTNEATPIIELKMTDNSKRFANAVADFAGLYEPPENRAVREAMWAEPVFHDLHLQLIQTATHYSERIRTESAADLLVALGWPDEDAAITAVEHMSRQAHTGTRRVGRQLFAVYEDKVTAP
jgi:hypothetical protein